MAISEKEFNELNGTPRTVGGKDPNSMTQRTLAVLPKKGGMTIEEVVDKVATDTDDEKKLKQALNALCYDKVKNAVGEKVTKVIKRHNDEHMAFYKLNPDYN